MKSIILALSFVLSSSAFASSGAVLLDCNISSGPDQQVTVRATPEGLLLVELTNSGSVVTRALSQKEWASKSIKLRSESKFESGTMKLVNGQWAYKIAGNMGFADCSANSYSN
jgi:hypothetical protein